MNKKYDVIVVGGGHAGAEAALSSARLGHSVLLITLKFDNIGMMSCNPAIGGVGKGQLVKEIDALGGEMAKAADYAGIQFRQLNASKGAAARSSRAQTDRKIFKKYMQDAVSRQKNIDICEDAVVDIIVKNKKAEGVRTKLDREIFGKAVIITTGTFMDSIIHVGLNHYPGGRIGEDTVPEISQSLKNHGITLMRFKTGTCARLDSRSIDFSCLGVQHGDKDPMPFSYSTEKIRQKQIPCYITYTNEKTHEIIRKGLNKSPLYTGKIKSTGVRYCPSLEDKIVRFSDRARHQVFLEPEGLDTYQYYPNGLSTSLPEEVQLDFLHSIKGLENAKVNIFGYGIEYDLIDPTQLYPTLEFKGIKNLYFAGQINGTTGYEEAAAQGLIAGINASLAIRKKEPFILERPVSYIGVLIDDLVTKGTSEPYRMFTSRVEYRLLLREDNADIRLCKMGFGLGLASKKEYEAAEEKKDALQKVSKKLSSEFVKLSDETKEKFHDAGVKIVKKPESALTFLKHQGVTLELMREFGLVNISIQDRHRIYIENEIKYEGYIKRQLREVKQLNNLERVKLPTDFDFKLVPSLSSEIKEKLNRLKPVTLGQASRISGVTPASISILMVYLKRHK